MSRFALVLAVIAIAVAGCTASGDADPVASIDDTEALSVEEAPESDGDPLLAFSACMRENGIDDFQDPIVDADGKVEFPDKADGKADDEFAAAFEACGSLLDGTALGADSKGSDVEGLDQLYAFAVCMRAQGFDVDDPDPTTGSLGEIDKEDPDFASAYAACESVFAGDDKNG